MQFNKFFYNIKPFIPRKLQIFFRRRVIAYKREKYQHIWPIDPAAGTPPTGWKVWPNHKKFAIVLSHDVDNQKGHDQCYSLMEIEETLGFRSAFNFVPEGYNVSRTLLIDLKNRGFEVGVHGLVHDGKLFFSRQIFNERAKRINEYLKEWETTGFTSPSMHHKLDWMHVLNITHSTSTFDTDPFEPQPDAVGTIFPLWVKNSAETVRPQENAQFGSEASQRSQNLYGESRSAAKLRRINHPEGLKGYVELPYTLPQDFTLFILMKEKNTDIWKEKLDWIAHKGGMALVNSHPDYMNFKAHKNGNEEYSADLYIELLEYIKKRYKDHYWHVPPKQMAQFWRQNHSQG